MNKLTTAMFAFCLAMASNAQAGAPECATVAPETISLPCHLQAVESVVVRLDGSAAALGLDGERLENDVRTHLAGTLPAAIRVASAANAATPAKRLPKHHGRFACTLWTVGAYFPIALFVECSLESLGGDQAIAARLLGHTRRTQLDDTVQTALKTVIGKVAKDLHKQRNKLRGLTTRLDSGPIN